jgi:hypothetical protein
LADSADLEQFNMSPEAERIWAHGILRQAPERVMMDAQTELSEAWFDSAIQRRKSCAKMRTTGAIQACKIPA